VVGEIADPPQTESDGVIFLFDDFERKSRADDMGTRCFLEELVRMLVMEALPLSARFRPRDSLDCIGSSWYDVIFVLLVQIHIRTHVR
jgi:hypothetical protein